MDHYDYKTSITVSQSAEKLFKKINKISEWWTKDVEGGSEKLNDEFIIHHAGTHYSKQRVVEFVPNKRIGWLVTDSTLNWLEKDKQEWTNTKMVFEIIFEGDQTVLHFTHEGLVPGKDCYSRCAEGWDMVIKKNLYQFVTQDQS